MICPLNNNYHFKNSIRLNGDNVKTAGVYTQDVTSGCLRLTDYVAIAGKILAILQSS